MDTGINTTEKVLTSQSLHWEVGEVNNKPNCRARTREFREREEGFKVEEGTM